jgi:dTDP-glucose 4,6-dehydratase
MSETIPIAVLGSNSFSGSDFIDLLLDDPRNRVLGISRSPEKPPWQLRYRRRADIGNYPVGDEGVLAGTGGPAATHVNTNGHASDAPASGRSDALAIRPTDVRDNFRANNPDNGPDPQRYQFLQADLNRDMPRITAALDAFAPRYIVNFAAQSEVAPSWEHPQQWFQTNTVALARLIDHLKDRPYLERYVHISSPEVYGTCRGTVGEAAPLNPSTPYAASKAAADLLLSTYAAHFDFPLVTVRATNVYGAGQQLFKIIPRSIIYGLLDRVISLHGGGHAVKSYIHIRDVSRGELAVMQRGRTGEIYHLAPTGGIAVRDVVRTICDSLERKFEAATEMVDQRLGQDAAYVIDATKAREELDWQPRIAFQDGIAETIDWIHQYWPIIREQPLHYVHQP